MKRSPMLTIDDLRDRCVIDADDGDDACWFYPRQADRVNINLKFGPANEQFSIGALLHFLRFGVRTPAGRVYAATCGHSHCCNPSHRRVKRRGRHVEWQFTPLHRARIANTKRAQSTLTMDDVREIRASDQTQREKAKLFGVSKATVGMIERHEIWREHGASVFNFGGQS